MYTAAFLTLKDFEILNEYREMYRYDFFKEYEDLHFKWDHKSKGYLIKPGSKLAAEILKRKNEP